MAHNDISGTVHGPVVLASSIDSVIINYISGVRPVVMSTVVGLLVFLTSRLLGITDWRVGAFIAVGMLGTAVACLRWKASRWQALGGVVVFLMSVAGSLEFAVVPSRSTPAAAAPEAEPERLAYATSDGIFLATAGEVEVYRIRTNQPGDVVRGLSWSSDGRFVAGTLHRSDKATRVWAYDVREGHPMEWPECSCDHVGFVGGELLAVRGNDLAVFSVNFDTPRFLTPAEFSLTDANVLGHSADGLLVALPDPAGTSAYGGPEDVYTVKSDGAVKRLYGTSSNKMIMRPSTRGDADYLAWKTGWRNGHCQDYEYVRAFHTANASTYEVDSLDRNAAWTVLSLRWSRTRVHPGIDWVLYSVQFSSTLTGEDCQEGDRQLLRSTSAGGWEQIPAPSDVLEGTASASGVLAVRTGRYGVEAADLLVIRDGVREPLAKGVLEMAWSA